MRNPENKNIQANTHYLHSNSKKYFAFTLSEVLITLVIIGVVAAVSIPTLIANHRKEEVITKLKKFYSSMTQVEKMARAEGNNWEYCFETYNSSKGSQYNSPQASSARANLANQCIKPYMVKLKEEVVTGTTFKNAEAIYLNDGSYFKIFQDMSDVFTTNKGEFSSIYWIFYYDVNGDRAPNAPGRDQFAFIYSYPKDDGSAPLMRENILTVWNFDNLVPLPRDTIKTFCQRESREIQDAVYCTTMVVNDGWKIKEDYPKKV